MRVNRKVGGQAFLGLIAEERAGMRGEVDAEGVEHYAAEGEKEAWRLLAG